MSLGKWLGGEVTTDEVATISSAVVLIGTKPTVREGMFWRMSLAVATVPSCLDGRYITGQIAGPKSPRVFRWVPFVKTL